MRKAARRWLGSPKGLPAIGWRYVFVADFGARHCQAVMKFEASHYR